MLNFKKIGIMVPHRCFRFPCRSFNHITLPQNLDHRNNFTPQLFHLLIHNRNRLNLKRQILLEFNQCNFQNMKWIRLNSGGNSKRYATSPIFSRILNGPIYLGLSFPLFWNRITPFQEATLRKYHVLLLDSLLITN